jgi:cyclophilin family peptidyl-prolyl cis-trans isomerase
MRLLNRLFQLRGTDRSIVASRRRRHRSLAGEQLEARQLLAIDVIVPVGNQALPVNPAPLQLDLRSAFRLADTLGSVVRVDTNAPVPRPTFFVELFDVAAAGRTRTNPVTAQNFLRYVNDGSFDRSIVHRSIDGLIQSGGYSAPTGNAFLPNTSLNPDGYPRAIPSKGSIADELGNQNVRGTIAMAKVLNSSQQPVAGSATSQWFVNVSDNRDLDSRFAAFGRVLGDGMATVDTLAAVPWFNAEDYYDTPINRLPLWDVPQDTNIRPENFVTFTRMSQVTANDLVGFTATSSLPSLVRAEIVGGTLVLSRAGQGTGTAMITVRASSAFNASDFRDHSFTVTVPEQVIEIEALGQVTLAARGIGNLTANGVLVTAGGGPVNYSSYRSWGWTARAAERIGGVNTIAWQNESGTLHFWRLSDGWAQTASDSMLAPGTPGFWQAESDFGLDFDGDGVIGRGLTVIEGSGSVRFGYDLGGNLLANETYVTASGGSVNYRSYAGWGWTAIAAENVGGTNTIVWRSASGSLHFWRLSSSWQQLSADSLHAPGTAGYHLAEVSFATDFDGNGIVGAPETVIENLGSAMLAYTGIGSLVVNGVPITSGGNPVNFHDFARIGYTAVGAEAVNGVNSIAWRMPDKKLHFWRMSSTWAHVSSDSMMVPGAPRYHAAEVAFGRDFDDDGVIGSPFTIIEAVGSVRLSYDRAGNLFANGTAITAGGVPVNYHSYAGVGYTARAAEAADGVNTLAWVTTDLKIHYWRLSSTWSQTSADSMIVPGKPRYLAAETIFGVDFDGNTRIGS